MRSRGSRWWRRRHWFTWWFRGLIPTRRAAILAQLRHALTRYVILPSAEATVAVALWIAASHAQDAWAHAPRLVIKAPEKRCGKSRLRNFRTLDGERVLADIARQNDLARNTLKHRTARIAHRRR